jgi:hypothetical protein
VGSLRRRTSPRNPEALRSSVLAPGRRPYAHTVQMPAVASVMLVPLIGERIC